MHRYYIPNRDHLKTWFSEILWDKFKTKQELALYLQVSIRTLTDWQRAKYGIPEKIFLALEKFSPYPYKDKVVREERELKKLSARKGGLATAKKGLPIGSIESRRRGGYASLVTHKLRKTGFFLLKECKPFEYSSECAELVSIIIGDGHLSAGQVEITLDARERPYAQYVQKLFKEVTGFESTILDRSSTVLTVSLSGKAICAQINNLGVEYGNKTIKQNYIPAWISENEDFCKAFIRGIFDTDGCLYLDKHIINKVSYMHLGIALSASNPDFLSRVGDLLIDLGFNPTLGTSKQLRLRSQKEVQRFVDTIKPVNKKHLRNYSK